MKLYELTAEYKQVEQALAEMLESGEIDEQSFNDTLESVDSEFTAKCENVAKYIKNLDAMAQAIKAEEQAMAKRRKALEQQRDGLKEYLKINMIKCEKESISYPCFKVSVKNNPPKMVIDNEQELPEEFVLIHTTTCIDKTALKEALKTQDIEGAHLEQGTRLEIK